MQVRSAGRHIAVEGRAQMPLPPRALLATLALLAGFLDSSHARPGVGGVATPRAALSFIADDAFGHFATREEVLGIWEMVPLAPEIQARVNVVNPWPAKYQYFVLLSDGRITWMVTDRKPDDPSKGGLIAAFNRLPGWNRFEFVGKGVLVVSYPDIPRLRELWSVQIVTKPFALLGVEHRPGDMLMSLDDGHGRPVYRRLLRRMPD